LVLGTIILSAAEEPPTGSRLLSWRTPPRERTFRSLECRSSTQRTTDNLRETQRRSSCWHSRYKPLRFLFFHNFHLSKRKSQQSRRSFSRKFHHSCIPLNHSSFLFLPPHRNQRTERLLSGCSPACPLRTEANSSTTPTIRTIHRNPRQRSRRLPHPCRQSRFCHLRRLSRCPRQFRPVDCWSRPTCSSRPRLPLRSNRTHPKQLPCRKILPRLQSPNLRRILRRRPRQLGQRGRRGTL